LVELIRGRNLFVPAVTCVSPNADYEDFYNFLKENSPQIWELLRRLPERDMAFRLMGISLEVERKDSGPKNLKIDFSLKKERGKIYVQGEIDKAAPRKPRHPMPLRYSLEGLLGPVS